MSSAVELNACFGLIARELRAAPRMDGPWTGQLLDKRAYFAERILGRLGRGVFVRAIRIFPPHSRLTVLFDPDRKIVKDKFGTRLYPETWVVDPQGVIRLRVDGPRDWSAPIALDAIEASLL